MGWSGSVVSVSDEVRAAVTAVPASAMGEGLRIDRRGTWFFGGEPFARKELVCLLSSRLRRSDSGGYEVLLPTESHPSPVIVEDVPFLAVEVFKSGSGRDQVLTFRTNIDQIVTLDAEHPLYLSGETDLDEPVPYLGVGNGLSARLSRPVYYELAALGEFGHVDGKEVIGLWSSGRFFVLGTTV
jgi:uncharacterized protein